MSSAASPHDAVAPTLTPGPDARSVPDGGGHFGAYGGSFIPETLQAAVDQLAQAYDQARNDPEFADQMVQISRDYIGRATPLQFAPRLTELAGGGQIWIKREDLAHTGAAQDQQCHRSVPADAAYGQEAHHC